MSKRNFIATYLIGAVIGFILLVVPTFLTNSLDYIVALSMPTYPNKSYFGVDSSTSFLGGTPYGHMKFRTDDNPIAVYDFYEEKLLADGWEKKSELSVHSSPIFTKRIGNTEFEVGVGNWDSLYDYEDELPFNWSISVSH